MKNVTANLPSSAKLVVSLSLILTVSFYLYFDSPYTFRYIGNTQEMLVTDFSLTYYRGSDIAVDGSTSRQQRQWTVDLSRNDPGLRGLRQAACRYFLSPSTIPNAGWGVYTAWDLPRKAIAQPVPDICFTLPSSLQSLSQFALKSGKS